MAEAEANRDVERLRPFWYTFADKATEDAYTSEVMGRAGPQVRRLTVLVAATACIVALVFQVRTTSPSTLQIAVGWMQSALFAPLAVWALASPAGFVHAWHTRRDFLRGLWLAAFVVVGAGTTAIMWDEYDGDEERFASDPVTLECEQEKHGAIFFFSLAIQLIVFAFHPIVTVGDTMIMAATTIVDCAVLFVPRESAWALLRVAVQIVILAIFLGHIKSVRVKERFNFILLKRLREENIFVQLQLGPYRTGRIGSSGEGEDGKRVPPWEIDSRALELGDTIGRGGFGEVIRGKLHGTPVAIKRLLSTKDHAELTREAALLLDMRHPNIVLFMGVCWHNDEVLLVTEFCGLGSLLDLVEAAAPDFTTDRRLTLLSQAASGFNYLHQAEPPVLHRDVKTANILVASNWIAKIADFGLASLPSEDEPPIGTVVYSSPEVLLGQPYEKGSDVFSFAIVMWETLSDGTPPYEDLRARLAERGFFFFVLQLTQNNLRPPLEKLTHCADDSDLQELIEKAWDTAISYRPSFEEIRAYLDEACERHGATAYDSRSPVLSPSGSMVMSPAGRSASPLVALDEMAQVVVYSLTGRAMLDGAIGASVQPLYTLRDVVTTATTNANGWAMLSGTDTFIIGFKSIQAAVEFAASVLVALSAADWGDAAASFWTSVVVGVDWYVSAGVSPLVEAVVSDKTPLGQVRFSQAALGRARRDGNLENLMESASPDTDEWFVVRSLRTARGETAPPEQSPASSRGIRAEDLAIGARRGAWPLGAIHDGTLSGSMPSKVTVKLAQVNGKLALTLLEEALELKKLGRHPNLVAVLGVCRRDAELCVVTEHVAHTLREMVVSGNRKCDLVDIVRQSARGVAHLHKAGIVHGELTSVSVAVSADLRTGRITDYGMRASVRTTTLTATVSPAYVAPEVLRGEAPTTKSDWYSLGMVLFEAASRRLPHAGKTWHQVISEASRGLTPVLSPAEVKPNVRRVFQLAVALDVEQRAMGEVFEEL